MSLDQNEEEDDLKNMQIPMMQEPYENFEFVPNSL